MLFWYKVFFWFCMIRKNSVKISSLEIWSTLSTKLLKEYGLWSAVKSRVSGNSSCSEVVFRMALARADRRLFTEILNCMSEAYKIDFLRDSSLMISVWVSFSLEKARSWVVFTYLVKNKSKVVGSVLAWAMFGKICGMSFMISRSMFVILNVNLLASTKFLKEYPSLNATLKC